MKVKMILPALTEARSPLFSPIKYSLFPPLGLETMAAYLPKDADISLQDEHVNISIPTTCTITARCRTSSATTMPPFAACMITA